MYTELTIKDKVYKLKLTTKNINGLEKNINLWNLYERRFIKEVKIWLQFQKVLQLKLQRIY